MVKITENPIEMDDFGGKTHYFRNHPIYTLKLTAVLAPENQRLEDEVSFWPWPIFRGKLAVRSRDGEAKWADFLGSLLWVSFPKELMVL